MDESRSGMLTTALRDAIWRRSRYSNSQGTCVELASLPGHAVAVRSSRDPAGPALVFSAAEIDAFIRGAKDGEFDDLLG